MNYPRGVPVQPTAEGRATLPPLSPLADMLRCLGCSGELDPRPASAEAPEGALGCERCGRTYPIARGTVRMLGVPEGSAEDDVRGETARSFGYEWEHFGALRDEWRRNFLDYMRPHDAGSLAGKLLLDVGAGSGRHSHQARELGARVVAVDVGPAIDVARRNLPTEVLTVQADAEALPFEEGAFDLVASIGVLHHLPDPERAFRSVARHVRPGGHVQIYLYWQPLQRWHRLLLGMVRAARRVTTRLPHRVLHVLSYPIAALATAAFVVPHRVLRRFPATRPLAQRLPLRAYADYPFGVCVNDQFDRFSAPLEHRYTRDEVRGWLERAGFEDVQVLPNHGWLGSGRRPAPA